MKTIEELRRTVNKADPRQVQMLAAINAIAELVGDDHGKVLAALIGAYVTVAIATGHGDRLLRTGIENLKESIIELTRGVN